MRPPTATIHEISGLTLSSCVTSPKPGTDVPVISLKSGELLNSQNFTGKDAKFEEVIIEVKEGDQLPLDVAIDGDVFQGKTKRPLVLKAEQPFRIYLHPRKGAFLSWDGEHYRPAFGAFSGSFAFGFQTGPNKNPSGSADATLNRK